MATIKNDIKCPKCKKKNRIKIYEEVNKEQVKDIISREIFTTECKDCKEKIVIDYPMKIRGENYLIYYTPGSCDVVKDKTAEILRVCDTYEDLKEKLLILEDGLNDVVIEFIKKFFYNQLDVNTQRELKDLRYDGICDNNIVFYLVGVNKSIGCTLEFYNQIKDKSKVKKIKKCVVVDQHTYRKYFRMRLI